MSKTRHVASSLAIAASMAFASALPSHAQSIGTAPAATYHAGNSRVTSAGLARFDARLTALAHAHRFSGTTLVALGDTVLLRKGYAMADVSQQINNSETTEFITGGLLEEFAAVAILQLEDAGKLHDQDRLCTYLPHCPATWSVISVHELLNQTSGIHDIVYKPSRGEVAGHSYSLAQLAGLTMREPLEHRPGSGPDSSVTGSQVIRENLVERVSSQPFGSYVQSHFLRSLGLQYTGYYLHHLDLAQHALGYDSWQDLAPDDPQAYHKWPPSGTAFTPYLAPAFNDPETYDMSLFGGAVYSTVDDTFRWEQAVNTGKVLSAASLARLMIPSTVVCQTAARCGAGVTRVGMSEGRAVGTWNTHSITYVVGYLPDLGFEDATMYFLDTGVTLVLLMNQNGSMQSAARIDRLLFS